MGELKTNPNGWTKQVTRILAALAFLIGLAALTGWILDWDMLKRVHPALVTMKANTAISLMLVATSLFLQADEQRHQPRWLVTLLALIPTLLGALTMAEHLFNIDFGIDQLLFRETVAEAGRSFPGRMGLAACVNFICLGLAVAWIDKTVKDKYWATPLALCAAAIVLLTFLYYFYGVEEFSGIAMHATIALHTVAAFLCLTAGVMLARPNRGIVATLLGDALGSVVARRLLPIPVLIVVLGWLRNLGRDAGLYGPGFGTAAFVLIILVLFLGLIWWTAAAVNRAERAREKADESISEAQRIANVGSWEWEVSPPLFAASDEFRRIFGLEPAAPLPNFLEQRGRLYPSSDWDRINAAARQALTIGAAYELDVKALNGGSSFWVTVRGEAMRNGAGEIVGLRGTVQDISKRREAEEALRQSEERLRLVTDNVPALISYIDRHLVYRFANDAYRQWFDRKPSEIVGRHVRDVLGEEVLRARDPYIRAVLSGKPTQFEAETTHLKLGMRHTEVSYIPEREENGEIRGFYVFVHDMHDRKVAEQALQTALKKLQAHFHNSPLAVVEWNEMVEIVQWSNGAEHLFGYPAAEIVGRKLGALPILHPEDFDRVSLVGRRLLSGAEPFILSRNRNLARDGRVLHCEWYNTVVRGGNQRLSILSLVLDVTERTRIEAALRESESRFRQLADAMPQLVWTANPEGSVDYYNERVNIYDGARRDDAGRWEWAPMVHPDDLARTAAAWTSAITDERLYSIVHRVKLADGTFRWHLSRALPVRDASGRVAKWFGTATDIDDQKRAEEKLEDTVAQRTAKLRETVAELEAFSYSIAHDMRAPLRSMSGYASVLRDEYSGKLEGEAKDFLRRIGASAERLDRLIQDVLNYSKIVRAELTLEPVAFGKLAHEIIQSYTHLQEPKATIVLREPLPIVRANPAALTQVISNLLGNAVKFVSPNIKPRVVIHSEEAGSPMVRICFDDNGIGIPPEGRQRIFQIFQRLNRPDLYEGTGIGLSIVRKAVERMGGRIGLDSEEGKGSCFWIELEQCGQNENTEQHPRSEFR